MNFQAVKMVPIENKTSFPIIQISETLARKLKLPCDLSSLEIQCSRNSIDCQVVSINDEDFLIKLDKQVLDSLFLFYEERTYLVSYEDDCLHIGPVIGLLTEISINKDTIDLRSIETYCREMAGYSEEIGAIFYVFTLNKHWTDKSMNGFVFEETGWKESVLPFPQVVHNRLHKRTNEKSKMFQQFTTDLHTWKIPYFNNHFLNKWTVHEQLSNIDHLLPYLPETELFTHKNLESLLDIYPTLFLKPVHGSQGKQIFKLSKIENGFNLAYSSLQQDVLKSYKSLADLYHRLAPHLKKRQYLIQQGLDLLSIDDRPVDFRYLCHRRENNRWKITSSTARASKNGSFVSNLSQGGEMLSVEKALRTKFEKKECEQIVKHLREVALEVAKEIGNVSEGVFGELGIDLAIDTSGRPWLIEVNTKPSKNMNPITDSTSIRPSTKAVILYCLFLISENLKGE
ncbi:YheC/YheD family endospore coat-associated protein [Sutcliffiella rhizosphaerae]|uniref:Endospore coat-associated protein YheD n=1 Tax=Sutcliffiella rhizosphaerae TaxID=2880967 RepID=A0ABM8YRJ6_9BACI|nr:YheC/YheD family protein [Sutcliffiella rhizosphaerae]CAG9622566.1 Endospore coat-associated protein YheD [Sutcliffiella rhizosphaerae]